MPSITVKAIHARSVHQHGTKPASSPSTPLRQPSLLFLKLPLPLPPQFPISPPSSLPPSDSSSIRLTPPRGLPTLALSIYSRPSSPSHPQMLSVSGPSSPPRPEYIHRPPSRSEHLLRDTLRRADAHDRRQDLVTSSPGRSRHVRQRKDSYVGPVGDPDEFVDGECECDEDPEVHPARGPHGSFDFLFRAHSSPSAPLLVRRRSSRASRSPDTRHLPYGSPSSPSPLPPVFARTRTAPSIPSATSQSQEQSTVPTVAAPQARLHVHVRASRHSLPNAQPPRPASAAGFHSHSQSSSFDSSPPLRPVALSPHEAVLRARLEGVLMRAGAQAADDALDGRHPHARAIAVAANTHGRSKSQSISILPSHNPQHVHEWPASLAMGSPDSLGASSIKSKATNSDSEKNLTPQTPSTHSPLSPAEPLTPPPTPPFNARTALETCKRMDGYVSFANVAGLGLPPDMDVEVCDDESEDGARRWARWLRVWPFAGNGAAEHETSMVGGDGRLRGRAPSR